MEVGTASSIYPEKAASDRTAHAFQMRYNRRVHVCKIIHNDPLSCVSKSKHQFFLLHTRKQNEYLCTAPNIPHK